MILDIHIAVGSAHSICADFGSSALAFFCPAVARSDLISPVKIDHTVKDQVTFSQKIESGVQYIIRAGIHVSSRFYLYWSSYIILEEGMYTSPPAVPGRLTGLTALAHEKAQGKVRRFELEDQLLANEQLRSPKQLD